MNRTYGRQSPRKSRHFTIDAPNTKEMVQLSAMIQGIKQYQDDEYKAMQAEFERVERLLDSNASSVSKQDSSQSTATQNILRQESTTGDQVVQSSVHPPSRNLYRYFRWMLLFFIILFFGLLLKMSLGRFSDHVQDHVCKVLEYLKRIRN